MAGYKTKQFRKSLAKKGFIKEEKTRHTYYHFFWKGKMTEICTFVSINGLAQGKLITNN